MLQIEQDYLSLLDDIKERGHSKSLFSSEGQQASSYVLSQFGKMLSHNFISGFPIYSHRKIYWKGAIAEMLWFLSGKSDIAMLRKMNCRIWDEWGYKAYCKSLAKSKPGLQAMSIEEWRVCVDEGSITSKLKLHYTNYTNWRGTGLDQTDWAMSQLVDKPFRKCYHINAWSPEDVYHMADATGNESVILPACHLSHTLNCASLHGINKLSLSVHIRSNDMIAGNPFNVVQYGALLQMYVHCLNNRCGDTQYWVPGKLQVYIDDAHIYENQLVDADAAIAYANSLEQATRARLVIASRKQTKLQHFKLSDFMLNDYEYAEQRKIADIYVAGGH